MSGTKSMGNASALARAIGHAIALHQRGDLAQAKRRYQTILQAHPEQFDALHCLGLLELQLGQLESAQGLISRALSINPGSAEAHLGLGNVYHAKNMLEAALECYDKALAIRPQFPEALNNRGNVLLDLGRHEPALASYDRALAIAPDFAEALNNRGNALHELRRYAEALASYDRALALIPRYADALNSRGIALLALNRPQEALASYDRALAIEPDYAEALNNRGNALRSVKRYEEAIGDFERALSLRPDYEYALGAVVNLKMQCCDWRTLDRDAARLIDDVRRGKRSTPPFAFISVSDSVQDHQLCARIYVENRFAASRTPLWNKGRYHHDKIRLAYLSADFREHAVAYLTAGLFESHDRGRFETTAFSFGPHTASAMRTRLESAFDNFIDVEMKSDGEVARLMRELEIDIAVDLMGFTLNSRTGIFALRPAPVQVTYLGYPGTLGTDYIDYIIADQWVIPEEHQPYYTEKPVYLPDTFMVTDATRCLAQRTPSRVDAGLPEDGFVFCSFNASYKITPAMFDVWMRLLQQIAGSTLWFSENSAAAVRNLRRRASDRGIDPARLVFAPRVERHADHLARLRLADLFLDTLPYNAHTTASDALWAGLPVLTCAGKTFMGKVAASLLNAIGLPGLITHSLHEYEALALKLAKERGMLADIKVRLARNRDTYPLFDTDRFRRHIEAAYAMMWERSQRGELPSSFAVAPIK